MNSAEADPSEAYLASDPAQRTRSVHDIRATLANTHKISVAFLRSFSNLKTAYVQLFKDNELLHSEIADDVSRLEEECDFCVERVGRSLHRLNDDVETIYHFDTVIPEDD